MTKQNKSPKVKVIETRDGSSSLLLPDMNETYHSTHGAITESKYVFLKMGLEYYIQTNPEKSSINILEIGFGTGLNPWLTALAPLQSEVGIHFTSLEKYRLSKEVVDALNYGQQHGEEGLFDKVHECGWEEQCQITKQFSLKKLEADIFEFDWKENSFDIIYFDAFAPSKQPEMWSLDILKAMYSTLQDKGIFVTYCAQGQFKRDLKTAGFNVETLEGPPGKKQMTKAL